MQYAKFRIQIARDELSLNNCIHYAFIVCILHLRIRAELMQISYAQPILSRPKAHRINRTNSQTHVLHKRQFHERIGLFTVDSTRSVCFGYHLVVSITQKIQQCRFQVLKFIRHFECIRFLNGEFLRAENEMHKPSPDALMQCTYVDLSFWPSQYGIVCDFPTFRLESHIPFTSFKCDSEKVKQSVLSLPLILNGFYEKCE